MQGSGDIGRASANQVSGACNIKMGQNVVLQRRVSAEKLLELKRHEDAVRVKLVVSEGATLDKAVV